MRSSAMASIVWRTGGSTFVVDHGTGTSSSYFPSFDVTCGVSSTGRSGSVMSRTMVGRLSKPVTLISSPARPVNFNLSESATYECGYAIRIWSTKLLSYAPFCAVRVTVLFPSWSRPAGTAMRKLPLSCPVKVTSPSVVPFSATVTSCGKPATTPCNTTSSLAGSVEVLSRCGTCKN